MMRSVLFAPLFLFAAGGMAQSKNAPKEAPKKPNIIFIVADDLGYGDIGPYGQTVIKTPFLDTLATEGMKFTQCYAGSTVCAPSRSSMMTGLHTGHTRVRGNANVPLQDADVTSAQLLKQSGYITGMIGKWGLGDEGSTGVPSKKGFDYFYGYLNQTAAHNYYPETLFENNRKDDLGNKVSYPPNQEGKGLSVSGVATVKQAYAPDKFLEKTLAFLDQHKDTSFFLNLTYTLPHANNEAKMFNQSGMEVPDLGQYASMTWPYDQKAHAAMISYLDKQVGTIMQKLKELHLDSTTLVIFTSDNGPHNEGGANSAFFKSSGPFRGAKRDMYEGGIRVPFIARWPGKIKAGAQSDLVIAFWDLMPTFCDVAGVKKPTTIDGLSFLPALQSKSQKGHEYLYWEFYEQGGKQAVRFGNWKCIKLNANSPAFSTIELYDLSKDPGEQKNVAPDNLSVVAKAEKFMKEAHVYSADFHFASEAKP